MSQSESLRCAQENELEYYRRQCELLQSDITRQRRARSPARHRDRDRLSPASVSASPPFRDRVRVVKLFVGSCTVPTQFSILLSLVYIFRLYIFVPTTNYEFTHKLRVNLLTLVARLYSYLQVKTKNSSICHDSEPKGRSSSKTTSAHYGYVSLRLAFLLHLCYILSHTHGVRCRGGRGGGRPPRF